MRTFRKIAAATDFGLPSHHAVRAAAAMAAKYSAELVLVHVVEPIAAPYPIALMPDPETLVGAAKREVDAAVEKGGDEAARAHRVVLLGNPAAEISRFVEQNGVDLVVSGTHGRAGVARWMLGSVAEKILRSSSVPVLIVHDAAPALRRVLAATDFGESSSRAVEIAAGIATTYDASLTLLHVAVDPWPIYPMASPAAVPSPVLIQPPSMAVEDAARKRLDEASVELRRLAPTHDARLRRGTAWKEIVGEAVDGHYDLVVVGTHGRKGPARWLLGSVAEKVVRSSRAPVLAVPSLD